MKAARVADHAGSSSGWHEEKSVAACRRRSLGRPPPAPAAPGHWQHPSGARGPGHGGRSPRICHPL